MNSMKIIPSYGPKRTTRTWVWAWICAGMLTVMLVTQLFGYEDFAATLAAILPFNDLALTVVVGAALVFAELLALPYLLSMYIGKLMRVVSALMAAAVTMFWLLMSLTNAHAANSGLFSSTLELPGGAIAGLWSMLLFGMLILVVLADSKFRHDTAST